MKGLTLAAVTVAFGFVTVDAGLAECEPMTVYGPADSRHVEFHDHDASGGASPGDKRFGRRVLRDNDGNEIGAKLHIVEIRETNAEGAATKGTTHFVFMLPQGEIFSVMEVERTRTDVTDTSQPSLPADLRRVTNIMGGTGIYAGASGTVEYVYEDGDGIYEVKADCAP